MSHNEEGTFMERYHNAVQSEWDYKAHFDTSKILLKLIIYSNWAEAIILWRAKNMLPVSLINWQRACLLIVKNSSDGRMVVGAFLRLFQFNYHDQWV